MVLLSQRLIISSGAGLFKYLNRSNFSTDLANKVYQLILRVFCFVCVALVARISELLT